MGCGKVFNYAKQKAVREYVAYFEPGDKKGSIAVYDEGIVLKMGSREERPVRFNYLQAIERAPGAPTLGKVTAEISYYNMFGSKESVEVRMREIDVAALRKDVGK